MPYYRWKGIALDGSEQHGTMHARSADDLAYRLVKQEIGIMSFVQRPTASVFKPIGTAQLVDLFSQLATLIQSGVYLDKALLLLKNQTNQASLAAVLDDLHATVSNGLPLSQGLALYPDLFDGMIIQLVRAGQESGSLAESLSLLADHMEARNTFAKKLRGAAFLPAIIFLFFLGICGAIFFFIVPMFASLFSSFNQELPASTQRMIQISSFLASNAALLLFICLSTGAFAFWFFLKTYISTDAKACALRYVPILGPLMRDVSVLYYLQAVALLLRGGNHLVRALYTARSCTGFAIRAEELVRLEETVDRGEPLSSAMSAMPYLFFPEVVALVAVGQESGALSSLLERAAGLYGQRVDKRLGYISTLLQPILLIILGFFVLGLIISVYAPILQMSYIIA